MDNENIKKKDVVKERILLFVIGVLVGAVISTAAFFVYAKTLGISNSGDSSSQQMPGGGTPPEMPSGENGSNSQGGILPKMRSGENDPGSQGSVPPEMRNNTNTNTMKSSNS